MERKFDICFSPIGSERNIDQWDFVLSHWKPDNIYLLGVEEHPWPYHNPLKKAICIRNTDWLPPGELVLLAPKKGKYFQGNVALPDFDHPEKCIYMFGPDHHHISNDLIGQRKPDSTVYIPTDTVDEMYAFTAAAVTLYDRYVKNG